MITYPLVIYISQYSSNQFNQEDQQQAEEILWMRKGLSNETKLDKRFHPNVSASESSGQFSPQLTNLRKLLTLVTAQ